MTDLELIEQTVKITLERLGITPPVKTEYISQAEAVRRLKRVNIGRAKYERLVKRGVIRCKKDDYDKRNSSVSVNYSDVQKILNL